jgi:hypothetical protein
MSMPNIQGRLDSSVGTVTCLTAGVRFSTDERSFVLLNSIETGSKVNGYRQALSPWVKWPEGETDFSPPSIAEVKKGGAIPPLLHTSSWHSD